MTDGAQIIAQGAGGKNNNGNKLFATLVHHPPSVSSSTVTRDSLTMDSLTTRIAEALGLSETAQSDVQKPAAFQGGSLEKDQRGNCAPTGGEGKQGNNEALGTLHSTSCSGGYVPSPGPKEQPNTNMRDVAEVDHVEEAQRHEQTHFMAVPLDEIPPNADMPEYDFHLLNLARHADPFKYLGCHKIDTADGEKRIVVVRIWLKNVSSVELRPRDGVSDWRLPPSVQSVPLERKGDLLFQKARA